MSTGIWTTRSKAPNLVNLRHIPLVFLCQITHWPPLCLHSLTGHQERVAPSYRACCVCCKIWIITLGLSLYQLSHGNLVWFLSSRSKTKNSKIQSWSFPHVSQKPSNELWLLLIKQGAPTCNPGPPFHVGFTIPEENKSYYRKWAVS